MEAETPVISPPLSYSFARLHGVVVAEGEAESEAVAVVANVDRGGHRRRRRVVPQVQELR